MTTSNNEPTEECRLTHDITPDVRQYAYMMIYRAQIENGDKLEWSVERDIFHKAVHDYLHKHPGKIGS
jgi:hypothetical protein